MDEFIELKFIDEYVGYGVFARKNIKAYHVLGEVAGEIEETTDDVKYTWKYLSDIPGYEKTGINCRKFGN